MNQSQSFEEYPHFFEVDLDLFHGPIDLLLHLVKRHELPLEKVSLAEVAGQYLHCLEQMRQFDLEIAGEYLVIAATLLSIKSGLLLGEPVEVVTDEDGNILDPHDELLARLREAAVYKEGAQALSGRGLLEIEVFAPHSHLKGVKTPEAPFKDHDPMLLGVAFRKVLASIGDQEESVYSVQLEGVSIVDRMMGVLDQLKKAGRGVSFKALVPDLTSRGSLLATFLALLELCKRQAINVVQDQTFGEIEILLAQVDFVPAGISSEFDSEVETLEDSSEEFSKAGGA